MKKAPVLPTAVIASFQSGRETISRKICDVKSLGDPKSVGFKCSFVLGLIPRLIEMFENSEKVCAEFAAEPDPFKREQVSSFFAILDQLKIAAAMDTYNGQLEWKRLAEMVDNPTPSNLKSSAAIIKQLQVLAEAKTAISLRASMPLAMGTGRLSAPPDARNNAVPTVPKGSIIDGPVSPKSFHWKGKSVELQPIPWKLLNFVWNEPNKKARMPDLERAVWGDEQQTDGKYKAAASKVNAAFMKAGCNLALRKSGEWAILE
jgi:hypothetical protein